MPQKFAKGLTRSSPCLRARRAHEERMIDTICLASGCAGDILTLCPSRGQDPKPEKFLKTKGLRSAFSSPKPENILKSKHLDNAPQF